MTTMEVNESEQLALLAELARPLVHESNNFLNNLFLHMMLLQDHMPAQLRSDWGECAPRRETARVAPAGMARPLERLAWKDE